MGDTYKGAAGDGTTNRVDGLGDMDEIAGIGAEDNGRVGGNGVATPVGDSRGVDAVEPWTGTSELVPGSRVDGPRSGGSSAMIAESGSSRPGAALERGRAVEEALLWTGVGRTGPSRGKPCGFGKPEVMEREERSQKSVQPMAGDLTAI